MAKKVLAYDNKILIMPSGEAVEAPAGGTGGGDMYKEDYDADEVILNAGGIEPYIEDELVNKADLINGKVPAEQLPEMDYIPTSEKGAAGGVAELDEDGKVPTEQLPEMNYMPNIKVTSADNGKFLRVVNGQWTAQEVPNAEDNSFGGN